MKYFSLIIFTLFVCRLYAQTYHNTMTISFKERNIEIELNKTTISEFIGLLGLTENSKKAEIECKTILSCKCKISINFDETKSITIYPFYLSDSVCDPLIEKSITYYHNYFIDSIEIYDSSGGIIHSKKCSVYFKRGKAELLLE